MKDKPMSAFGSAPIKMEGGVSSPDEWTFECQCVECLELRKTWQDMYEVQQKQLRGES
jgi:hypothetical protein